MTGKYSFYALYFKLTLFVFLLYNYTDALHIHIRQIQTLTAVIMSTTSAQAAVSVVHHHHLETVLFGAKLSVRPSGTAVNYREQVQLESGVPRASKLARYLHAAVKTKGCIS